MGNEEEKEGLNMARSKADYLIEERGNASRIRELEITMASALNKILSGNGNLIQIVTGKDRGEDAWHCVLVVKNLIKNFHESMNDNDIPVDAYGRILRSGWGAKPPQEVLDELAAEYM